MNRLNKILLSFVLLFFCLLACVSNAFTLNEPLVSSGTISSNGSSNLGDITVSSVFLDLYNKYLYPEDENIDLIFNQRIQEIYNATGYNSYLSYVYFDSSKPENFSIYFFDSTSVNVGLVINNEEHKRFCFEIAEDSSFQSIRLGISNDNPVGYKYTANNGTYYMSLKFSGDLIYMNMSPNLSIYNLIYDSSIKTSYWDGTYYGTSSEEVPTMPTNSEIAQAVQAFYDSDYYKNNTDFKDFLVMYNYNTQYFSFVGHNFDIDLGQVIVPPDYEYDGYSYNQEWWKFFLRNVSSEIASNLWNKYFWLYSTNDFGATITSEGKGAIKDLVNLHFSTNSIIVYSTTDYPVVKIETDENGILTPVEGTVPGNQYTYDETLNPTENEYNPLKDFVPTDPSQSILSNIDFNEINKAFEENKNILNIENASWLFTANNKLVEYFMGFLSFLIVLIIISRLLGG